MDGSAKSFPLFLAILGSMAFTSCLSWFGLGKNDKMDDKVMEVAEVEPKKVYNCASAREFITVMEYLKDREVFAVQEKEARTIADKVSSGCSGAAKRFISVTEILTRSQLDSRSAMQIAVEISLKDDDYAEAFTEVFRKSFMRRYLDLDLSSSIRMAKSLSLEFKGDPEKAEDDFETMVKFCISSKGLDLPKPQCAELAGRVTRYGQNMDESSADAFIELVNFLREDDGGNIAAFEALKLAEEVVAISPHAVGNFIKAYKYGISERGMKLNRMDAVSFAKEIAGRTKNFAEKKST